MTTDSPAPPSFRAFVAVVPPASIKAELEAAVKQLSARDEDEAVRWVAADALHITLAFLGQIPESKATSLVDALEQGLANTDAFELDIGNLETFGDRRRRGGAQVVWTGLRGNVDALQELHELVSNAVRSLSLRVESRAFQPHITLGRVRRGRRWRLDSANTSPISSTIFPVDAVTLMESRLGRGPAKYVERGVVELTKRGFTSRIREN